MNRSFRVRFFGLALALGCSRLLSSPQQTPFALKIEVALVPIDVAVYDSQGNPVHTLTSDDFLVYEDGVLQQIQHFASSDTPYNMLLLFDASGSTRNQLRFLLEAGNRFLRNLKPQDQVAVASFDGRVTRLLDWQTRAGPSRPAPLPGTFGGTDLYGALQWTANELSKVSARKGVLVFTDGQDQRINGSLATERRDFQSTLKSVEQSRSPFYFVAINTDRNPAPGSSPGPRTRARERMEELAERSGGRVFFPKTLADVTPLYEQIAREFGASYTLAYGSTKPAGDGTYRRVEVRLKTPGFRISQSRTGYYADGRPQFPTAGVTSEARDTNMTWPVLVTPIANALLPPPARSEWRFDWEDVPGAAKYQIVINPPGVAAPVIDSEVRVSQYALTRRNVYSAGQSPRGWTWKVRAQTSAGHWGPWSDTRPFDVFVNEPVR